MRKRVIIGITALSILFLLGDIASVLHIRRITSELITLIEPHESEMMREDLVISGASLQTDLFLLDPDKPELLAQFNIHLENIQSAISKCLSCHHNQNVHDKQIKIKALIHDYQNKLPALMVASDERAETELKTDLMKMGKQINTSTFEISMQAGEHMETRENKIIERAHRSWIIFLITLIIGIIAAFYVAYSFSRKLIAPMDTLLTATKRIANGDLGYRAVIDSKDEFAELADSFNTMTENLKKSYEIISQSNIKIRETRDYLAALISSMDDSVIVVDRNYRLTDANPAFYRLMKLPEGSIKDQLIEEISFEIDARKVYPLVDHPIKEVFENGTSKRSIKAEVIATGEVRSFEITASPILAQGKVDKVLEVIRDITERVEMEKAILLRDKELKETQEKMVSSERLRALGEMAAGIAHGFNNILSGILGNIQNLLEDVKDPEMKNMLKLVENTTLDGAEIVRRIQEFSRVRKGGIYNEVNINEVIEDTLKITEAKWKNEAASWGIRFDFKMDLQDNLPIYGNPAELREALTNIFLNAFEAMPDGGRIFVSTRTFDSNIEVVIEDTGKGMDEKTVKKVFDPFFTTKGVKGTGLGLGITYGIVTRHEGEIRVASTPGKGTRFIITLPIKETVPAKKAGFADVPSRDGNILIIDDEPMILSALETMLKRAGHEVTCRNTGESGLAAVKKMDFDVIITDLGMQDVSGWEITKAARAKDCPGKIIMLTGWGFQIDLEHSRNAGVDLLISKPFTKKQILNAINKLLSDNNELPA